MLAFAAAAQTAIPWTSSGEPPKKANLKGWADHICSVALAGAEHEHRRHLYKTLLEKLVEVRELADAHEVIALG